ncbi:MAG TPA: SOS response-associated peptidase family protein [Thermomonas sp.]|nr:SOS response-associated peptidase family protein [Thermomonas sp.]
MCYSAQVWSSYRHYQRAFGGTLDIKEFVRLYEARAEDRRIKIPKGVDLAFLGGTSAEERRIQDLVRAYNAETIAASEPELFKQVKRLADAERALQAKPTKKALNDQRIAGNKIRQLKRWIADAKRTEHEPERDDRIFPDWYAPVLTEENGERIIRPMRYHCRPAGMDPSIDRTKTGQVSGTYNARRDNLARFWRPLFGQTHALLVASVFYENVDDGAGGSLELQFRPKTGEDMLIACLASHWIDPKGQLPDLYSFAAITDEPEPEVAAAGHDRTIINLKPQHVDAWLDPQGNIAAMQALLDDKRHPYYEHRRAAA